MQTVKKKKKKMSPRFGVYKPKINRFGPKHNHANMTTAKLSCKLENMCTKYFSP